MNQGPPPRQATRDLSHRREIAQYTRRPRDGLGGLTAELLYFRERSFSCPEPSFMYPAIRRVIDTQGRTQRRQRPSPQAVPQSGRRGPRRPATPWPPDQGPLGRDWSRDCVIVRTVTKQAQKRRRSLFPNRDRRSTLELRPLCLQNTSGPKVATERDRRGRTEFGGLAQSSD